MHITTRFTTRVARPLTRLVLLVAATFGILFAGSGVANATIASGGGGYGYLVTRCEPTQNVAQIEARVVQDYAGQPVAARVWFQDSRGWHITQWVTKTSTGWDDGYVSFNAVFSGLTGTVGKAYVQYGWWRGAWVIGGEYPRYYQTTIGLKYTYCPI